MEYTKELQVLTEAKSELIKFLTVVPDENGGDYIIEISATDWHRIFKTNYQEEKITLEDEFGEAIDAGEKLLESMKKLNKTYNEIFGK